MNDKNENLDERTEILSALNPPLNISFVQKLNAPFVDQFLNEEIFE